MQNDVVGHDTDTKACGPSPVFLINGADHAVPLNVSSSPGCSTSSRPGAQWSPRRTTALNDRVAEALPSAPAGTVTAADQVDPL